jgi:hypothetical protein
MSVISVMPSLPSALNLTLPVNQDNVDRSIAQVLD